MVTDEQSKNSKTGLCRGGWSIILVLNLSVVHRQQTRRALCRIVGAIYSELRNTRAREFQSCQIAIL